MNKIMEMIPGLSGMKIPKDMIQVQDEKLKKWKFIMQSMTKKELEEPDLVFNRKRIDRIAKGSGCTAGEVRELLKQYRQSKKMMKMMKGDPEKLMKKFKGTIPGM
jgi:signal recognition particle subunit SRP54